MYNYIIGGIYMKKILAVIALISISILNSCTINWIENGEQIHYDVPFLDGIIFAVLVIAIIATLVLSKKERKYYTCPNCNHRFKPYRQFLGSAYLRCPKCHKASRMSVSYNQKDIENDK